MKVFGPRAGAGPTRREGSPRGGWDGDWGVAEQESNGQRRAGAAAASTKEASLDGPGREASGWSGLGRAERPAGEGSSADGNVSREIRGRLTVKAIGWWGRGGRRTGKKVR